MDYKRRFTFNIYDGVTANALERMGIKYKQAKDCAICVVEIMESDEKWPLFKKFLDCRGEPTQTTVVYTKSEIEHAEWFAIRTAWRWEYPQPDSDNFGYKKGITYVGECLECAANAVQVGNFRVRRSPKWHAKAFLMINWVDDVLFTSETAKNMLENSKLKGFHFQNVLNTKGTVVVDDIYQLCVETMLPPGLVITNDTIREVNTCTKCGSTKYLASGRGIIYKKDAFANVETDIVMSDELFGAGDLHIAVRHIIISRQFYEVIIANKLDKQLILEPVMLI